MNKDEIQKYTDNPINEIIIQGGDKLMTKLAEVMNEFFATGENYSVEELITEAEIALDSSELAEALIDFIYHLDEVLD